MNVRSVHFGEHDNDDNIGNPYRPGHSRKDIPC